MYPVKIFGGTCPPNGASKIWGEGTCPPCPSPTDRLFVIDSKISDLIANKLICQSRWSPIVVRLYL